MAAPRDHEGLQVDHDGDRASKAPEPAAPYDQNYGYAALGGNQYAPNAANQSPTQKVPFGLSVLTFGILVAAVTAIVVGGGVGGGLGAALSNCNSKECPSVPTSTAGCDQSNSNSSDSTNDDPGNYAPLHAADVGNVTWNCPENGSNGTLTTQSGYDFNTYCGVNAPASDTIKDILSFWAYYFEDCIGACADLNYKNVTQCDSVFFRTGMNMSRTQYGNCWLKSGKLKAGDDAWTNYLPDRAYAEIDDSD
ncbi:hypothetical protein NM208_g13492 [Fusarium decemcellulare]|uniref:Uncharacterized protein n=1 Tax=Fusarium decemcellulare TaxID=57161 RepID=A0ACC1RK87_9HYPO|nr:hypothetical protein NM208_g13492 [Fusarium decemcellulare]